MKRSWHQDEPKLVMAMVSFYSYRSNNILQSNLMAIDRMQKLWVSRYVILEMFAFIWLTGNGLFLFISVFLPNVRHSKVKHNWIYLTSKVSIIQTLEVVTFTVRLILISLFPSHCPSFLPTESVVRVFCMI